MREKEAILNSVLDSIEADQANGQLITSTINGTFLIYNIINRFRSELDGKLDFLAQTGAYCEICYETIDEGVSLACSCIVHKICLEKTWKNDIFMRKKLSCVFCYNECTTEDIEKNLSKELFEKYQM